MEPGLLLADPLLRPYAARLSQRHATLAALRRRLLPAGQSLIEFAAGHLHFGLHFNTEPQPGWILREWAPNATAIYLIGEFNNWQEDPGFAFRRVDTHGGWELRLPADALRHGQLYRLRLHWNEKSIEKWGDRIPAYARRVVQDPQSLIFNAQVWVPPTPFTWRHTAPEDQDTPPLIYEAHVGMAQEEGRIGTYAEFTAHILPRIVHAGYNTLQLMALPEHPYYASFGYQVSSFFAPSSRFGTPDDLKALIDAAHGHGLRVMMDLVHSHAVKNEVEGLSRYDGSEYQFFHAGRRGEHPAWGSRCFDYGKPQVLHFLLSNCRFWLDEYRLDGFRFDGITSMLYHHHGLNRVFGHYDDYFDEAVDEDALAYLALANELIHALRPDALIIAEDVSGMPGLAAPVSNGGSGFDYRFAMGVPDYWIKLIKDTRDEDWPMGHLWHELTNHRREEKTISYAESHDQALVGDQTLMFRLGGDALYHHMTVTDPAPAIDRALALHKMIRLITLATSAHGYLNFMGNEFGHPDWIDFPREGNQWSFAYARRQWHLADDNNLKYRFLADFDRDMLALAREQNLWGSPARRLLHVHEGDNIIIFARGNLIFAFNFHPHRSVADYEVQALPGRFGMLLDSDAHCYGGHGRLDPDQVHFTQHVGSRSHCLRLYLPTRTAIVLSFEEKREFDKKRSAEN